jgi:lysozyme
VSAAALVSIAINEGYRGEAYQDAVGVPTVGYGETKGVTMKSKTTPDRALVQLLSSTEKHADDIRQCIKVPLYQHEFDAYVSLAYNIGAKNFCGSTLVRKLNIGDYSGACEQIKRWNKAGGKVLSGLTRRRKQEYRMCMGET